MALPDNPDGGAGTRSTSTSLTDLPNDVVFADLVKPDTEEAPVAPKAEEVPALEAEGGKPEDEKPTLDRPDAVPAFDPSALATQYGLDADLVKDCKTPQEALAVVAKQLAHNQLLTGRQANELGQLRRRLAEPKPQPKAEPEPQSTGPAYEQFIAWAAQNPVEANEWLQKWEDENPIAARRWVAAGEARLAASAIQKDLGGKLEALELRPKTEALNAEWNAFAEKHKIRVGTDKVQSDPEQAVAKVQAAADALGLDRERLATDQTVPLEDLYQLGLLMASDAAEAQVVMGWMVRGMTYTESRRFADLDKREAEIKATAGEREQKLLDKVGATGPGAPARSPSQGIKRATSVDLREMDFGTG